MFHRKKFAFIIFIFFSGITAFSQKYQNFKVAVYTRAFEVKKMGDTAGYLKPLWNEMTRQLKIDKIYLETHRDLVVVDQNTLDKVKKFFKDRGVETAGGITFTISEPNRFQTFCYSDPNDRKRAKDIVEYTAKNFDEMILDDFFFTNCKDDAMTSRAFDVGRDAIIVLVDGHEPGRVPDRRAACACRWQQHGVQPVLRTGAA